MKKQPLISIIIPIYNIMDCLEKCVDSCINQTYKNIEILMIDDGSTDGTGELCDKLKEKDDRIRVFHKPNGGSSSARNLGIENAKEEYLGFVDSDDFISPTMYEDLMKADKIAKLLGYEDFDNYDEVAVYTRGYRVLNKIPRMPSNIVENLVKAFI